MNRKASFTLSFLLLVGSLSFVLNIQPASAQPGIIYIRADGSIDPPTGDIITSDYVTYAFTHNIVNYSIVVERSNIVIDGAGFTLQGIGAWMGYEGIDLTDITNVTVTNTNIINNEFSIRLSNSSNNSIYGNNITNNLVAVQIQYGSRFNSISSNNITNNYHGIELGDSSSNNSIIGNIIAGSYGSHGITLGMSANYNSIIGNNITNNHDNGIWLYYDSNYNSIIANSITANNGYGIVLSDSSSYNSIIGNEITNKITNSSGLPGIGLLSSPGNLIAGNNITNNADGIHFDSSSINFIIRNNIANNNLGVALFNSPGNFFYQNSFADNNVQASCDATSINVWNITVEGNYWSNYTGVDVNPHDGIGDTPHAIDANNQDNCPLMTPYIPGDYNHDGIVNMTDADMVRNSWQSKTGDLNYNPHVDFDMNGLINIKDATIIGINWLKHA